MILLDTNILIRRASPSDPLYPITAVALQALDAGFEECVLFPQSLYEFWATATRPIKANGLGMTVPECWAEVATLKQFYPLLADKPGLFDEWERLVVSCACSGRVSYDARLVAAMNTHGIAKILTFNVPDFTRFPGITVIDPRSFLTAAAGS